MVDLKDIQKKIGAALEVLLEQAAMQEGDILILGCSSSEVLGKKIGSASSLEVAEHLLDVIYPETQKEGIFLAVQCCEHLNRALVVEEECAWLYDLEIVNAIPHPDAGGATATMALKRFQNPVLVESIQGHAGIDIGDTFIGMHLRPVAVPVRPPSFKIGEGHLTMARTRPRLIGGKRTKYNEGSAGKTGEK